MVVPPADAIKVPNKNYNGRNVYHKEGEGNKYYRLSKKGDLLKTMSKKIKDGAPDGAKKKKGYCKYRGVSKTNPYYASNGKIKMVLKCADRDTNKLKYYFYNKNKGRSYLKASTFRKTCQPKSTKVMKERFKRKVNGEWKYYRVRKCVINGKKKYFYFRKNPKTGRMTKRFVWRHKWDK
jgi:hypothetical protein